ncbi:MAG: hypothetical protein JWM53_4197 [bacterium]|nr:hypothetical protein [bacterium]
MAQTILEAEAQLSRSRLWRMQRAFFERRGPDAWREAIVPHYVTSNPFIAAAYAQLVFGYWRDVWPTLARSQPLYVVELGAGAGRFAFHFLRAMTALLPRSPLADVRFVYVLTDVAERNLEFVAGHPALAPFVASGQLDFARFDATSDDALVLGRRGLTLGAGDVANPLVAVANYVFDGVPQDMFYGEGGRLHESLVTLACDEAPEDPDDPALIAEVALRWTRRPADGAHYGEERRDAILEHYRARLPRGAFSFPTAALRAIDALAALSGGQMLLLSADKGQSHEATLARREEPALTVHGSFSLPVNYHAIGEYVRLGGGKAMTAAQPHARLNVCAFTLGALPGDHVETALAFAQAVERVGPDDFYCLKKAIDPRVDEMSLEQLLAFVRLSGADMDVLLRCRPALSARAAEATAAQRRELGRVVTAAWAGHYAIDEARDVAFELGGLLCDVGEWEAALPLFEASLAQHGPDRATLFNLALCRTRTGQHVEALALVAALLGEDPSFDDAHALRREITDGLVRATKAAG